MSETGPIMVVHAAPRWWRKYGRDVWLFLISLFLLVSVVRVQDLSNKRQDDRKQAAARVCAEANQRHEDAIPLVARLVTQSGQAHTPAQRAQQKEVLSALEHGTTPQTPQAHQQLVVTELFIEVIAPRYDCSKRVRELS